MEIIIIGILLLFNGVFAMYEIALVSARKSKLEEKAKHGNNGARTAIELLKEPEKILSAIQVGITLVGIVSGAYGGLALAEDVSPLFRSIPDLAPYADSLAVILVVGLITYLSLIIGELVPKTIALNNPEAIASFLSPAMKVIGSIAYPVVWFLSVSTKLVLKVFRIKNKGESLVTEEELRLLLKQGSEHGAIEKEESEMISDVIRFGDKRAGMLMKHRIDVEWLDINDSPDELLAKALSSVHSRLLVCNNSIDDVKGVLNVRELLANYINNKAVQINEVTSEPLFIPEQVPALKVLEIFRESKNHFGIVVNEYGAMEGIITLHDLTENIMGDFPALGEDDEPEFFKREDGSYLIDGALMLDEVKDLLEVRSLFDPEESGSEVNTLGGFAMVKLERIPEIGNKFTARGFVFEIVDMDGNRVDKLLVKKII
ncbi:MAG: hemolysin family protein [Bacteroidales bacterium]